MVNIHSEHYDYKTCLCTLFHSHLAAVAMYIHYCYGPLPPTVTTPFGASLQHHQYILVICSRAVFGWACLCVKVCGQLCSFTTWIPTEVPLHPVSCTRTPTYSTKLSPKQSTYSPLSICMPCT